MACVIHQNRHRLAAKEQMKRTPHRGSSLHRTVTEPPLIAPMHYAFRRQTAKVGVSQPRVATEEESIQRMTHLLLQWLPSELFHRIKLLWREVGVVSGCHLDLKFAEGIISKRYKAALDGQIDLALQVLQVLGNRIGVVTT